MKNLKLYSEVALNVKLQSSEETIVFSTIDVERNRFFFLSSSNSLFISHFHSFHNGKAWRDTRLEAEVQSIHLEGGDYVTSFDYLMEKEALIIGTANGLLLLHSVDDDVTEVVGQVQGGVKCVSPSPDGDLLAVVSGFGQILLMTHDWDLLYENSIEDYQPGDNGICESDVSSRNMLESSISWRGDGKYFATMSEAYNSSSLQKRIKVWERDSGESHATSDTKAFMGTILEWMPSGVKIAAVYDRKLENQCPDIVFYERNGLVRSSFSINEPADSTVELLKWNCSSDLLASVVRCGKYDSLKVWYFSNNHWYLKHEMRYPRQDGLRFTWDPIKPLQLICWTLGGQISVYNFIWVTAVMDNSIALVIDDSRILVTPLSLALMPPPLHLWSFKFNSAVREIALFSEKLKKCLAAFLSDGCFCVTELPDPDIWEELEGKDFSIEASFSETAFGSFVHFTWLDSHALLAVSHYGLSNSNFGSYSPLVEDGHRGFYLLQIEIECSEDRIPCSITGSGWHSKISHRTQLEEVVIGVAPNPSKKCSAFIQFDGGKILEYTSKLGLSISGGGTTNNGLSLTSSCPLMSVVLVGNSGKQETLLFGLDDIGRLQVGGKILCNNCSSFSFYSNLADQVITHLILTTKQDLLFIVDIGDILHGEAGLKYENFIHIGNKRKEEENMNFITIWERGAKISGVLHGDEATVIIQTTRGNLECIYPRKLVLASIINALNQGRYKDALLMVRRHRINFNVIVDHCGWQTFILSATEFVKQNSNLNHLTEFVCAMKNENVMDTLYKHVISFPHQAGAEDVWTSDALNKISSVLLAIRKALEEQTPESPARELCILTTLAHSDPPALEEALERIKVIRDLELLGSDDTRRSSLPSAEEALKHLLLLSDSEAVFEAALGLYDLNLAAIVALNSQKDPKEFLPYLQELERMPSLIMRYTIDLRLRRFEKALKHIVSAGDTYYVYCMNLLNQHPQLFPLGLQLISDPTRRMQVIEAWADHLIDAKCFEDAATTYLSCSNLEKALKAYRACGDWSGVLTVAGLLKLENDEVNKLAHELCEELQALGKPGQAAKIALDYCSDVTNGVSLLVSARDWSEALRVAFMCKRDDLISEVKSACFENANTLIGEYEEGLEKVGKYLSRYLAVRQRRLLLAAKLQAEEQTMNDVDYDTVSEASSNFSRLSAYTTGTRKGSAASVSSIATSKARDTRHKKSRGKIRPGSPGEELALVEHLKGMSLTDGAKTELKSLLVSLVMLGGEETARKLQRVAENFQLSQTAAVKLAEDTVSSDSINEQAHTLDRYVQNIRTDQSVLEALSWRSKLFISS